jgi:hypothetical protein
MINPIAPEINFTSPEWARFQDWLGAELLEAYQHLANPATNHEQTMLIRGRAAFITRLLTLGEPLAGPKTR